VDTQEQNLALVSVGDSKQGRESRWPRAGAGAHVDRGVGEELLAPLKRDRESAGRNRQPAERSLEHTAAVPLEMTKTWGPASVVRIVGQRRTEQDTGQGENRSRAQCSTNA